MFERNFSFTGIIEEFAITSTAIYRVSSWGASGGGTNKPRGAFAQSFIYLEKGSNIYVLVGESGGRGRPDNDDILRCGGGGGGTFVAVGNSVATSSPLCVAGGGGSQMRTDIIYNYGYGQATRTGGDLLGRDQNEGQGGLGSYGSGGGGFYSNGVQGSHPNYHSGSPGKAFISGGARVSGTLYSESYGGFGGGAANSGTCGLPQGGGGYSGGSSYETDENNGGGGGSFFVNHSNYIGKSIAGYDYMPSPTGSEMMLGNLGHGYVNIVQIQHFEPPISCIILYGSNFEIPLVLFMFSILFRES